MLEVALEVVGEREVIADVPLERAGGDVARVRLSVGLDLVGLALGQLVSARQVGDRLVQLSGGDVAMPAMAIEARVVGEAGDPLTEDRDRFVEAPGICGAAPQPDDRVGVGRRVRVRLPRLRQLRLHARQRCGWRNGTRERLAEQRVRLHHALLDRSRPLEIPIEEGNQARVEVEEVVGGRRRGPVAAVHVVDPRHVLPQAPQRVEHLARVVGRDVRVLRAGHQQQRGRDAVGEHHCRVRDVLLRLFPQRRPEPVLALLRGVHVAHP